MMGSTMTSIHAPRRRLASSAVSLSVAVVVCLLTPVTTAQSQDGTMKALSDRMSRLERQISDLERWSFRDGKGPQPSVSGTAPGAPAVGSGQLADAELRLSRLESQVRDLNGQIERMAHDVRSAGQRLDKLVGDVDFRLTEIERQLNQQATTAPTQPATAATTGPQTGAATTVATQQPQASAGAPQQPIGLPDGTPMERYDFAYALLSKQKLVEAQQAFEAFLVAHGDDKLAGNAQYWLGEIYYTNGDFQAAAKAFLEGVQRYPDGNKAPDSMLKLAVSLRRLEQIQEACATMVELGQRFPDMESRIRRRMEREQKAAGCP